LSSDAEGIVSGKVVDDFLNFDMRKSRKQITEKQAR
jgi:hypothetical protein